MYYAIGVSVSSLHREYAYNMRRHAHSRTSFTQSRAAFFPRPRLWTGDEVDEADEVEVGDKEGVTASRTNSWDNARSK